MLENKSKIIYFVLVCNIFVMQKNFNFEFDSVNHFMDFDIVKSTASKSQCSEKTADALESLMIKV